MARSVWLVAWTGLVVAALVACGVLPAKKLKLDVPATGADVASIFLVVGREADLSVGDAEEASSLVLPAKQSRYWLFRQYVPTADAPGWEEAYESEGTRGFSKPNVSESFGDDGTLRLSISSDIPADFRAAAIVTQFGDGTWALSTWSGEEVAEGATYEVDPETGQAYRK